MLPTHDRYRYSSIVSRPDYTWPGGRRLAVYIAVNIEAFGYGVGKGAAIAPPDQAQSHSIFSWRDYGNRVGVWRFFDLFDALGLPAEAQMNVEIYTHCPDIPERIRKRGDEILGHGVTNSEEQGHLGEAAERELIARVTSTIERHEGARPAGWMSPWLSNSGVTLDLLREAGYRYVMDWTMDDQPVWLRTRKGRILSIPYPIEVNDTRGIIWYHHTSQEFADMITDQFDEMLEQSARQPLVCPISLHPFVFGRPYRIRRLRRALQHILGHRDRVWITRPRDICAHIESLPAGTVPGARTMNGTCAPAFVSVDLPAPPVPLSPMNRMIVRSASPASSTVFTSRPTRWSMYRTFVAKPFSVFLPGLSRSGVGSCGLCVSAMGQYARNGLSLFSFTKSIR